jgi:S1-C subfamily serine protease
LILGIKKEDPLSSRSTTILAIVCVAVIILSGINSILIFNVINVQREITNKISNLTETLTSINQTALANATEIKRLLDELTSGVERYLNQTPANIYEDAYKSVVVITTPTRQGSGFLYNTSNMILTNWHVVEGETDIHVKFYNGTIESAALVGLDAYSDVAVLMVPSSPPEAKPLQLGNSSNLYVGQQVVAIGNPLGLTGSLSSGYVSQVNKIIEITEVPITVSVVQLDITLAPGNSGGPLLDMSGNVVGITNAGTSYGFNFAIPSNIVKRVFASIVEKGYYNHPFIGFYLLELTPEVVNDQNIFNIEPFQSGLLVWDVIADYPAEQAGLKGVVETIDSQGQPGYMAKDIILAVDGHQTLTIAEWTSYVEEHVSLGQTLTLTVWRSGITTTVDVTATYRPPYEQ